MQPNTIDARTSFFTSGFGLRAAALALAVVGMLVPAYSLTIIGVDTVESMLSTWPWVLIFPAAVLIALLIPLAPPLVPHSRLVDIAAAVIGVCVFLYVLSALLNMQTQLSNTTGTMAPFVAPAAQTGVASSLQAAKGAIGIGSFIFGGGVLLQIGAALSRRRA